MLKNLTKESKSDRKSAMFCWWCQVLWTKGSKWIDHLEQVLSVFRTCKKKRIYIIRITECLIGPCIIFVCVFTGVEGRWKGRVMVTWGCCFRSGIIYGTVVVGEEKRRIVRPLPAVVVGKIDPLKQTKEIVRKLQRQQMEAGKKVKEKRRTDWVRSLGEGNGDVALNCALYRVC